MPITPEALATDMREQQARTPSIAEVVPYLLAVERIRELTYGKDTVRSADVIAILYAIDLVERAGH